MSGGRATVTVELFLCIAVVLVLFFLTCSGCYQNDDDCLCQSGPLRRWVAPLPRSDSRGVSAVLRITPSSSTVCFFIPLLVSGLLERNTSQQKKKRNKKVTKEKKLLRFLSLLTGIGNHIRGGMNVLVKVDHLGAAPGLVRLLLSS